MEYGFSRKLYPSQIKLIQDVINTINQKKMAIVSSPTGTGKTLSLLCALTNFVKKSTQEEDLFELLSRTNRTKIYYCSRTHSQLSQVISELRSCKYRYKSIILGSRKVYCVNNEVNKITNIDLLNDRCKEMIRDDSCKYHGKEYYTHETLDIEELKACGIKERFCPYYHAKNRSADCEIVLLPYNLLFTAEGRKSLDISLKDKIVVVDEAHNIYDTVIQLNSAELSWDSIKLIFNAKGLSEDLKFITSSILSFRSRVFQNNQKRTQNTLDGENGVGNESVYSVVNFLIECKIAKFNMLEIADFIETNKLAQKNDMKSIFEFAKFLKLLTFSDSSGRIFANNSKIKFSCISPKMYFEELSECASVIFAGGTMEPIASLKAIFPEMLYFTYPAVNENFESVIITETVTGKQINLSFSYRNEQIDDVLNTLIALSNPVVTGGVVIFVPSKQFMELLKKSQKIGNFRRKVYFGDDVLFEDFKSKPEILIAIMGGSLSEGINFSDEVCRLLVVVGVPYPTRSVEIMERAKSVKDYETLVAMKTVNQTVGRAIRHKDDYAAIVLLDCRYLALKERLSPWLHAKTKICKFSEGLLRINSFLKSSLDK
ncbi:uncharacterized protein VICG_00930 [Vittaforma corneae ATCC 50505]|uniref:DNA 5'-3' helicase n=1 Tax=Vittaforma corneae (strain ATCC 50505) TaxID=993615 RepID=L2GMM9_VITCO|nr:uncharacterized protein VICG_00930 [Vittaforma corneae ATCC 50505]ELA42081.1 hypothetical protein VICG_00930 [Vittaforma corneae ATCC 50505]